MPIRRWFHALLPALTADAGERTIRQVKRIRSTLGGFLILAILIVSTIMANGGACTPRCGSPQAEWTGGVCHGTAP